MKKTPIVLLLSLAVALCLAFTACTAGGGTPEPETSAVVVTFDANGGNFTDGLTKKTATADETTGKVVPPDAPTYPEDLKDFVGWGESAAAEITVDFGTAVFGSNTTLYAIWRDKPAYTEGLEFTPVDEGGVSGYSVSAGTAENCDIIIPAEHDGKPVVKIAEKAFYSLVIYDVFIPATVTEICTSAFDCSTASSITFGDGSRLKTIGDKAFKQCEYLTGIDLPDGVTSIGEYAFHHCLKLVSVGLPSGIEEIKSYTFEDCKALESITVPAGVTTVGDYAFNKCSALTKAYLPGSLYDIGDRAFHMCKNLTDIRFSGTTDLWQGVSSRATAQHGENWQPGETVFDYDSDFPFSSTYVISEYTVTCTNGKLNKNGVKI